MQLYMSWYILSFLALSLLLKYSLFFKYSCTNNFHRRGLCTFYMKMFTVQEKWSTVSLPCLHIGHIVLPCVEFFLVLHVARQLISIPNRVKIKRISGFWIHVKYFYICTSSFNADKVRNLDDDLIELVMLCRYWSFSLSVKALWKHPRS